MRKYDGPIDWRRIKGAIRQQAKKIGKEEKVESVAETLGKLVAVCGHFSSQRRALTRIGVTLLSDSPTIIAPICPDYSHENGRYTFRSLGSDVPLLAQLHISFLKQIITHLPDCPVTLLIADHEADNSELCAAVRKSREAFRAAVFESIEKTRTAVASYGWKVEAMTDMIKSLIDDEITIADRIGNNPGFAGRISAETSVRSDMYRNINWFMTAAEMKKRTVYTAAQYIALGTFAARNHSLVCNHTTTNLSWYLESDAGVLHNPVSIY